ncbi:MAG: maltose alpha-D-glucosyltransferase [Mycobacteriales bacterium]
MTSAEVIPLDAESATWYKDAVIYEAHVRAFADSDGDGIGDFRGLLGKLDYLQELGITALWLLPFYPSPLRDDGYDISDYRKVHEAYGTLRDFRAVLRGAHARGIKVITELVLAHTSDEHPWFKRARMAPPGSTYRDFYTWSDTPNKYADARIIFQDFETSNWAFDPVAKAYYWHRFYSHQPSLNYDSPHVRQAMFDVVDYWLEMGVDGLRLDAVPYLYSREGTTCENLPETYAFLQDLRQHIDSRFSGRMLLAEANQWPEDAVKYLAGGEACQMAFHFPLMPRIFMAARQEDRFPIVDILNETPPIPANCQWGLFLRNHDELTLEMVTDEERDYMYKVYAEDPQARVNVGIRRRLAPLLGNDRRLIEMMNGLLFSLPGAPIVYYGDEIGMGDNIYLGDRNGVRTPMQWDADRNAGFSAANPQRLYLPVIIDPEYHAQAVNVAAQEQNPTSLLWWMRRLIALRNRYHAFARGELEMLFPENRKVLAFLRRYEDETILVVVNLSRFTQAVELDLAAHRGAIPVELFGSTEFPEIGDLPYFVTLGGHGFYWFSLEQRGAAEPRREPIVVAGKWTDAVQGSRRAPINRVLPTYLASRRWFRDKSRRIRSTSVVDVIEIPPAPNMGGGSPGHVVVVDVNLDQGLPERYALAVGHATADEADEIRKWRPDSVLCDIKSADGEGVLYDALTAAPFAKALLASMGRRRHINGLHGRLEAVPMRELRRMRDGIDADTPAAPVSAEQSNTSVVIGSRVVVKVIRRVEEGINPDVEVSGFLTDTARFPYAPKLGGSIEYRLNGDEPATLAVAQEFVANEGDGWSYVLDALSRVLEEVITHPAPDELKITTSADPLVASEVLPPREHPLVGPHLHWAEVLGKRTAELHLSLASSRTDEAFLPEAFTAVDRRSMHHGAKSLLRRSLRTVRTLTEPSDCVRELLSREAEILDRFESAMRTPITARKIRCHGDYHLGQVLWTGKDFVIIDFEGEPARPLSSRRLKKPPLLDVAGMIRSFHYASRVAGNRLSRDLTLADEQVRLDPLTTLWYRSITGAFLRSYLEAADEGGFLPTDRDELSALLDFLLLEKAIYEVGYEADNRPTWVDVPARGVLELLDGAS